MRERVVQEVVQFGCTNNIALMSFTYSIIGLALGIAKVAGYILRPSKYNFVT
jgi:hypothetical protein